MKIKLVGVFTAIVLAFVFLTGRAAALNLTKGDEYQKQVTSQMRSGSRRSRLNGVIFWIRMVRRLRQVNAPTM